MSQSRIISEEKKSCRIVTQWIKNHNRLTCGIHNGKWSPQKKNKKKKKNGYLQRFKNKKNNAGVVVNQNKQKKKTGYLHRFKNKKNNAGVVVNQNKQKKKKPVISRDLKIRKTMLEL